MDNTKDAMQQATNEEVVKQATEAILNVEEILSISRRQEVAGIVNHALETTDLTFYEAILGMCDFTSTILTMELSSALETPDARKDSQERVNVIRGDIVDILNKRQGQYLAEDMIAIISLLVESVIIGIKREAQSRAEEEVAATEE